MLVGVIGPYFWDVTQARVASAPLNMPPMWVHDAGVEFQESDRSHPLGTDSSGRDILALLIAATPGTLKIGLLAAGIGMGVGIILGFTAGFLGGGWIDATIQIVCDAMISIPSLAVLIVISAYVRQLNVENMGLLLALFAWPLPTRVIRAQVLSMRQADYVQMAPTLRRLHLRDHVPRDDAQPVAVSGGQLHR